MSSPDVVILGMPGSGKTVFLSILHDTFAWTAEQSVDSPMGFRLEARGKDTLATMGECMAQMRAEKWPAPTHEKSITMLSWDVFMGTQKMFSLSSMDYGGEVYRKAYGGFGVKRDERRQRPDRGTEGSSAANDMLSDVSGAEEKTSETGERDDDECVRELRAAVQAAKVVCIFISVSDFLPKVKDAKDAKAAKEALQVNRYEAALTACSLLDDEELARKCVLVLTQAHGKRDAIDLSGGPRNYLSHISKSLMQAAERHVKVPVLALSAVNEDDDDRDSEKPPKTICSEGLFAFLLYVGGCVESGRLNKVKRDYLACRDAGGRYHFLRMRGVLGLFEDRYAAAVKYHERVAQFVSSANDYMREARCFSGTGMQDTEATCRRAIEKSPEVQMCRDDSSRALALESIWDALLKEEAAARVSCEEKDDASRQARQPLTGTDILALAQQRYRELHGVSLNSRQVVNIPVFEQEAVAAWIDDQLSRRVETLKRTVKSALGLVDGLSARLENADEIKTVETLETIERWKSSVAEAERTARTALEKLRKNWPFEWPLAQVKDMSDRLDDLSEQSRRLVIDGRVHSLDAHLNRYGTLVEVLDDVAQAQSADDCKRELRVEGRAIVSEFEAFVSAEADSRRAELWARWEALKVEKERASEKSAEVNLVESLLCQAAQAFSGGDVHAAMLALTTAEEKCRAPIFGEEGYRTGQEKIKTMRADMTSARRRSLFRRTVWFLVLPGLVVGIWVVLRVRQTADLRMRAGEVNRLADSGNYREAEKTWLGMKDFPVLWLKRDSFVPPDMGQRLATAVNNKIVSEDLLAKADAFLTDFAYHDKNEKSSKLTQEDLGKPSEDVHAEATSVSNACVAVQKFLGETRDSQPFSKLDLVKWKRCENELQEANVKLNAALMNARTNLQQKVRLQKGLDEFRKKGDRALANAQNVRAEFEKYVALERQSKIPMENLGNPAKDVRNAASVVSNACTSVSNFLSRLSLRSTPDFDDGSRKVSSLESAYNTLQKELEKANENLDACNKKKLAPRPVPPPPVPPSPEAMLRKLVSDADDLAVKAQNGHDVSTVRECQKKLSEIEEMIKKHSGGEGLRKEIKSIRDKLPRLLVIAPYRDLDNGRTYLNAKPVDKPQNVWKNPETGMNEAVFDATDLGTMSTAIKILLYDYLEREYPELLNEETVPHGVKRVEWPIDE